MLGNRKTDALRAIMMVGLTLLSIGLLYGMFVKNSAPLRWADPQRVVSIGFSSGYIIVGSYPGVGTYSAVGPQDFARYQPWSFFGANWTSMLDDQHQLKGFSLVVPAWMLLVLTAWYPLFWLMIRGTLKRRHRRRSGLCARCGYDLRGTTSGRCPECGAPSATVCPAPHPEK